jgi:hypothetical protein
MLVSIIAKLLVGFMAHHGDLIGGFLTLAAF